MERDTVQHRPSHGGENELQQTLSDKTKLEAFRNFLLSDFSEENLAFILETQKFEKIMDREESRKEAKRLFSKYIERSGMRALNIDDAVVTEITDAIMLDSITPHLFARASKQCYDLIESGSFPRFLKSVHFLGIIFRYLSPTLRRFPPFALMQKARAESISLQNSSNSPTGEWKTGAKGKAKGGDLLSRVVDNSKNSKLYYNGCTMSIAASADKVARTLLDFSDNRKNWDSEFLSGSIIERLGDYMFIVHTTYSRGAGFLQKGRLEDRVMLYSWFQFDDKNEIAIIAIDILHDHVPALKTHVRIREDGYFTYFISPTSATESVFTTISQYQVNTPVKQGQPDPTPNKPTETAKTDPALFLRLQKYAAKVAKDNSYSPAKEIKFVIENQPQQLVGSSSSTSSSFPSSMPFSSTGSVDPSMILSESLMATPLDNRDDLRGKPRSSSDSRPNGLKKNKSGEGEQAFKVSETGNDKSTRRLPPDPNTKHHH